MAGLPYFRIGLMICNIKGGQRMFCEKCGTQNADDAKFCENCGNPLSSAETENNAVQSDNAVQNDNVSLDENVVQNDNVSLNENVAQENNVVQENNVAQENIVETENTVAANTLQQENNNFIPTGAVTPEFGAPQTPGFDATGNQAPAKKKAPVKLIAGICAGVAVLIAAIITIVLVIVNSKPSIDLNEFLVFKAEGYDGYGRVTISVDWDAVDEKYGEDLKFTGDAKDKFGDLLELAEPVEALKSYISIELDKDSSSTNLKNGDKVKYKWVVKKDAEKYVKCKLEYKNSEYAVSGLEKVETFDAFEGVSLEFKGSSNSGYGIFNYSGPLSRYDFDYQSLSDLKNGDVITVSLYNQDAQYYIDNYKKVPESFEKEFTVEGLTEYITSGDEFSEDFLDEVKGKAEKVIEDVFNDYDESISYTEMKYEGYLFGHDEDDNELFLIYSSVLSSDDSSFADTAVYYPVSIRNIVKDNGDFTYDDPTSVLAISYLDEDGRYKTPGYTSLIKACIRIERDITLYDSFEVKGFDEDFDNVEIVTELADINKESTESIAEDAKKRVEAYAKHDYGTECSISDLTLVGQIFGYDDEAEEKELGKNVYCIVYSAKVSSADSEFEPTTVYYPVVYYGLYKTGDGKTLAAEYEGIFNDVTLGDSFLTKGSDSCKQMYEDLQDVLDFEYAWEMTEDLKKLVEE